MTKPEHLQSIGFAEKPAESPKCRRCGKPYDGEKVFCPACFADPTRLLARTRGYRGRPSSKIDELERAVIEASVRFAESDGPCYECLGHNEHDVCDRPDTQELTAAVQSLLKARENK